MRINEVKYMLLSMLNMSIEKNNYDNTLPDILKNFSVYIKDLELNIDDIADNIENILRNNSNQSNIYIRKYLINLRRIICEDLEEY